jgi:hypothetical protein
MSGSGKSIRDSLAGKELTGFKKSSEQGDRAVERASSAKVTILKAPKKPAASDQA